MRWCPRGTSPRQTAEQFERLCRSVPLRRGTSPEEIAGAVLAIVALPSYTGQMIALDGGPAPAQLLVVEMDREDAGPADQPGVGRDVLADDPVAVPVAQPGRRGVLERSMFEI